jgi:uncharacterized membrane protein YraQ (UPF0718 family)
MTKNAIYLLTITFVLVLLSFAIDRNKTLTGIKKGIRMFVNVLFPFLNILILISVFLYFLPPDIIPKMLGSGSGFRGILIAAAVGSVSLIPGFISYPIAATAISQGATYSATAVFITTLMMVGFITLPLEMQYFGKRAAVLRNFLSFIAAIIIGLPVGYLL